MNCDGSVNDFEDEILRKKINYFAAVDVDEKKKTAALLSSQQA
jgi:hypothetical protein